jgi:uncharacterized membrane protein YebE (DUF533 family)
MHCIKCGKSLPPGATFCAHCGAKQSGGVAAANAGGTPWLAISSMVAGVAILAGMGYWGWNNYAAKEEAARKAAATPTSLTPVGAPAQPQLTPDEARERAEIVAAQAALAKHIIDEENAAKARSGVK